MKFEVHNLTGENAITTEDGQAVYDAIKPDLSTGRPVELDFTGVAVFASLFFNAAIGQLLKDLSPDDLNRLLTVSNLVPAGQEVWQRVVENAKKYYSSPDYREAQKKVLKEMSEEGA